MAGQTYERDRAVIQFPEADPLHYVFLGPRNRSPTDRAAYFVHANTARALIAVWLAADDLTRERALLVTLGAVVGEAERHVPDAVLTPIVHLREGEVVLLPASRQLVPGLRVVGLTLRVASLAAAERVLALGPWTAPSRVTVPGGTSIFLPPSLTHGLWIELRQPR